MAYRKIIDNCLSLPLQWLWNCYCISVFVVACLMLSISLIVFLSSGTSLPRLRNYYFFCPEVLSFPGNKILLFAIVQCPDGEASSSVVINVPLNATKVKC